ncbi:hypothetical protein FB451DRAFT_1179268 [Mycena latifolia]|nr:hypothetical protein FB451DRAFT_1179268 [Mycena latifolia]
MTGSKKAAISRKSFPQKLDPGTQCSILAQRETLAKMNFSQARDFLVLMAIPTITATQFTQILWILIAILVLYILFGVLFLVVSHLQERLQRRPDGECPLQQYSWHSSQPWDTASLSADKDLESQLPEFQCGHCNVHVQVRYEKVDGPCEQAA